MFKGLIIGFFITMSSVFSLQVVFSQNASAALFDNAKGDACAGSQLAKTSDCLPAEARKADVLIKRIVNLLSVVVGIIAVIMIIVNGLRFIISKGDANAVSSARNGIIYAVIGLAIVAIAQFIVRFVIKTASG